MLNKSAVIRFALQRFPTNSIMLPLFCVRQMGFGMVGLSGPKAVVHLCFAFHQAHEGAGVLLQVSCQSSTCGQSVLVQGVVQASCLDNSTACLEMILEPSPIEILLQYEPSHASSSTCHEQSSQPLQSTTDILDASSDCLRSSPPQQPGLSVLIRCIALSSCPRQPVLCTIQSGMNRHHRHMPSFRQFCRGYGIVCDAEYRPDADCNHLGVSMCRAPSGPLRVRLSELRLRTLRWLLAQLRPSARPSPAGSSSPHLICNEPLNDVTTAAGRVHAAGLRLQAGNVQQPAAIELENFCDVDLQFGQLGTAESITIPQGGSMCYR